MHNDYKIINIIDKFKDKLTKYEWFNIIYDLKTNLEFNSQFSFTQLYKDTCELYKDPTPIYNNNYTPNEILCNDNEEIVSFNDVKEVDELINKALDNPNNYFYVIESGDDNLDIEIAQAFWYKIIPDNIYLPKEYVHFQYTWNYFYHPQTNTYYYINHITNKSTIINTKDVSCFYKNINEFKLPTNIVICEKDEYEIALQYVLNKITNEFK